jgi:hypothetical protein
LRNSKLCRIFRLKIDFMKHVYTVFFLFCLGVLFGQSNLTIFNNDGRQFYVILNGIKQNAVPQTNVYISGIKNGTYSVKLIFADGVTKDIDKNLWLDTPSDITGRVIFKKGEGKLQLSAPVPTQGAINQSSAVVYRPNDQAVYTDQQTIQTTTTTTTTTSGSGQTGGISSNSPVSTQSGTNMNVSASQSVQSNASSTQQTAGGVNMNVNISDPMNGGGIQMNVNVSDPTLNNGNMNMGTQVSSNAKPGSSGSSGGQAVNGVGGVISNTSTNSSSQTSSSSTTISTTTTTTSSSTKPTAQSNTAISNNSTASTSTVKPGTCKSILGDDASFVKRLKALTFDADRVATIRKDMENQCLVANQAYKIVETLTFSSDRLDISKYLFDRIIDKDKGNVLLPLFTFDSEKEEFQEYMSARK